MNLGLTGRVALITGGSRGIGAAVAEGLAREGAWVSITYRSEREKAEALVEKIRAFGGNAMSVHLDLASADSITAAVETVTRSWGRLEILVNNAVAWGDRAPAETMPFEKLPPHEWQQLLRANIEGAFASTQLAVAHMRKGKWGRIVNVSAVLAEEGLPGHGWYSAAKAASHGLTRTLSKELGPSGILVNGVLPGMTVTDRVSQLDDATKRYVAGATAIRRLLVPDDVAAAVVFLCSGANTAITGELLRVSGGRA